MFRKRRSDTLPTSSNATPSVFHMNPGNGSSYGSYGGGSVADGSGKAIRMEAPVARAWKKATMYTKGSYYATAGFIFLAYFGYRWLRWNHASIHLMCHTQECTFTITPRGWNGSHKVTFPREQLVRVEAVKVTNDGDVVALSPRLDDFQDEVGKGKNKNKKKTTSYKGPDKLGHYPSYRLTLKEFLKMPDHHATQQRGDSPDGAPEEELSNEIEDVPLTSLEKYLDRGEDFTMSTTIRKHGIYQSRRRVKTTVQKIDSYIKRRRHKLTVKENTPPAWQGILMLVIGLFGLLLTLLVGQFWEPETTTRRSSGPGTRVRNTPDYKGKRPQVANPRLSKKY